MWVLIIGIIIINLFLGMVIVKGLIKMVIVKGLIKFDSYEFSYSVESNDLLIFLMYFFWIILIFGLLLSTIVMGIINIYELIWDILSFTSDRIVGIKKPWKSYRD